MRCKKSKWPNLADQGAKDEWNGEVMGNDDRTIFKILK
jgi:hypothetical protein